VFEIRVLRRIFGPKREKWREEEEEEEDQMERAFSTHGTNGLLHRVVMWQDPEDGGSKVFRNVSTLPQH
jgi:hypothetical protein